MQKIGFVVSSIINAGPVNVVYDIVKNIDRTKFEPVILALKSNVEYRSRVQDFEQLGIKIHFFNFSVLKQEIFAKKCAKIVDKFINENEIKMLHLHCYHSVIIAKHLKSDIKKIVTIHNLCYEDFTQKRGFILGTYEGKRYCNNLKHIDCCITITNYMNDYYKNYNSNIITIYNGISNNSFYPCSLEEKQKLREKYNMPSDSIIFVVCNSLHKRKNTIAFINAANKFTDDKRKFIIVGDGEEEKKLKEIAQNNKNIIFMGRQKNVVPFLQMSDFYVTASKSEGCPLAPMEAMFCGLPIIYSNIVAHKELFYSLKELQSYMFNLTFEDDLYQKLKNATPIENIEVIADYYREKFSAQKMSTQYQEIYSSLCPASV